MIFVPNQNGSSVTFVFLFFLLTITMRSLLPVQLFGIASPLVVFFLIQATRVFLKA